MYLGIEIGGTKLQLGVGKGDGPELLDLEQIRIDPARGATGILEHIERVGRGLLERHQVTQIGIGFGGPVDVSAGRVTTSHQITGWDGVPLVDWCQRTFGLPARMDNDCNVAALAEARLGAGQSKSVVFYVTVGTGVGGGLVVDGNLFGSTRPAIAEIGHLRPGLENDRPDATVESVASGWGIASNAIARLRQVQDEEAQKQTSLLDRCNGDLDQLPAEIVASGAQDGDPLALEVMQMATQTLGWAIAQVVTLLAPNVVVVGGGVSKIGNAMFLEPLSEEVRRYVFPPLAGSYQIVPAALGDLVVVHGALALADESENKCEGRSTKDETV